MSSLFCLNLGYCQSYVTITTMHTLSYQDNVFLFLKGWNKLMFYEQCLVTYVWFPATEKCITVDGWEPVGLLSVESLPISPRHVYIRLVQKLSVDSQRSVVIVNSKVPIQWYSFTSNAITVGRKSCTLPMRIEPNYHAQSYGQIWCTFPT